MLPALDAETRVLEICSEFSLDSPIYRFCSGIDPKKYEEMHEIIHFDVKSVRQTFTPFLRVESVKCFVWFELSAKCTKGQQIAKSVMCPACGD